MRKTFLLALLLGACSSSNNDVVVPQTQTQTGGLKVRVLHDLVAESGPGSALPDSHDFVRLVSRTTERTVLATSDVRPVTGRPEDFLAPRGTALLSFEYFRTATDTRPLADFDFPLPPGTTAVQLDLQGDPTAPVHFVGSTGESAKGFAATTLLVNDQPTFLQGAGCDYTVAADTGTGGTPWFSYVTDLGPAKANAVRTYGVPWNFATVAQQTSNLSAFLAQAKASNFYVLAGLPYDTSTGDMATLIPQTMAAIQNDPNFGQVLGWCIGNENPSSDFPGINAVVLTGKNAMTNSTLVRPVMTALPAVSSGFVATVNSQLSNLDWLAINNFYGQYSSAFPGPGGFLNTQAQDLTTGGFTKPWVISEYYSYDLGSTLGIPSVTLNGQALTPELNSTQNAANYAASWNLVLAAKSSNCVGGLALNWAPPHNSKLPAYYKHMYAYRGAFTPFINPPYSVTGFDRFQCVDTVATLYGGSVSTNPCPQIVLPADNDPQGVNCTFKGTLVPGGSSQSASVSATDNNPLTYDWYLIGGTAEGYSGNITGVNKNPQNYTNSTSVLLASSSSNNVTFTVPSVSQNNYQLRVIVRDGMGGAATAVVPFGVQ